MDNFLPSLPESMCVPFQKHSGIEHETVSNNYIWINTLNLNFSVVIRTSENIEMFEIQLWPSFDRQH